MLDTNFLKSLMSHDFYEENKEKLSKQLFDADIKELYEVIESAHEKYQHDLQPEDLFSLWQSDNPTATKAERHQIRDLIQDVQEATGISYDIASDSIENLWRRNLGKIVGEYGMRISEGHDDFFSKLCELVDKHKHGYMPNDIGSPTTLSIKEILEKRKDEGLLEFYLPTLRRRIAGVQRGRFGIIFATPETGKTAFCLSLAVSPGGYVDQGHSVLIIGNEESTEYSIERAYGTALGYTKEQISEDIDKADMIFKAKMDGKLKVYDAQDWDLEKVEACINDEQPSVVFIDQLDKISVRGSFNATHERLGEIYRRTREVAKRTNSLIWGVSQASADATNKTRLTYDMMAGSKTNKAAEADIIIGIGKHSGNQDDMEENTMRFLTISKNKINGWHGTECCTLHGEVSRYVE